MFSLTLPWLTVGTSFSRHKESPILADLHDFKLKLIAHRAEVAVLLPTLFWFDFDGVFITERGNLKINTPRDFCFKSRQQPLVRVPMPRYNTLRRRSHLRHSHGARHLPISLRAANSLICLFPSDLIGHANLHLLTLDKAWRKEEGWAINK